ncbi:hypothetical protein VEZ01S_08_02140 [Vibrio ezurae NBRC 102218]|uniref:DUF2982 domain-containing protein n=1 Tax=Vibrio ezurae NBRC 102218 TaxID=1219080 RepID=U3CLV9_9VIBR|nr:hypothetical protein VEZ01S_08_02140 [Vibrio ezurae NBRC 102218]
MDSMPSLQLTNQKFILGIIGQRIVLLCVALFTVCVAQSAHNLQGQFAIILIGCVLSLTIRHLYQRSVVRYTLTDSHFQQHTAKGGWVIQWHNVAQIGICQSHTPTERNDLPWIGVRLKDPVPFVKSVCPRLISQLLLEQRALLYLGAMETGDESSFQEQVLDSRSILSKDNQLFTGLQAGMLRRMQYQRAYWGYDIFIASADLERDAEEFVGLLRQYWANSYR